MENNAQRIKSISSAEMAKIEELEKLLGQKAARAPQYNPSLLKVIRHGRNGPKSAGKSRVSLKQKG